MISSDESCWQQVLGGGDDYQVLCSLKPGDVVAFQKECLDADVRTSCVGMIESAKVEQFGNVTLDIDGEALSIDTFGYTHF